MGWWSVFGKPTARKASKPGTPAHDDLVRRNLTAVSDELMPRLRELNYRDVDLATDADRCRDARSRRLRRSSVQSEMDSSIAPRP
jgi:putative transposase